MSLLPCPSCARHVRRSESACPFCGNALALEPEAALSVVPRLGRAALFTFGAALATSACTGTGAPVPLYGAPSIDSGAADAAPPIDAGNDATVLAMYGGPPIDAGSPGPLYGAPALDSGGISDHDTGGASSDYGAPPPPPEA
jgi:hypothetical protein